ncbi:MAG: hypothetical protein WC402_04355 [Candidatus Pacearchaeota archaeon]|jgi:hypothetical protein
MFNKLKLKDYLVLSLLVVLAYIFTATQKYYIPDIVILRSFLVLFVCVFLFLIFFFIKKPVKPLELAKTLSILLGIIAGVILIVQHLIMTFTPSIKNIIVFLISIIVPFISGFIYELTKRNK